MDKKTFIIDLTAYINNHLIQDTASKVTKNTPLFEDQIINSLKIIELIAYVEKRLGITIKDDMISMENFRSITTIADTFCKYEKRRSAK